MREFVAYAKTRPGQLNYASPGTGSIGHLANVLLAKQTGIEVTHIAYKGTGPAVTALMAGGAIVDTLNREIVAQLRTQALRDQFATIGVIPETGTPQQFASYIRSEIDKWGAVMKYAGMKSETY